MITYFTYGVRELDFLKAADSKLAVEIERIGAIKRETDADLFRSLLNSITGQQISRAAKRAVWTRITESLVEITPENVAARGESELRALGLSTRKAQYFLNAAHKVLDGSFDISALPNMTDSEVCAALVSLDGVGVWTAEMLMIFALERPDILSFGDAGIRSGLCRLHGLDTLPRELFEQYRKLYSPYGSTASLYLWEIAAR